VATCAAADGSIFSEKNGKTGKWGDGGKDGPQEMTCSAWFAQVRDAEPKPHKF